MNKKSLPEISQNVSLQSMNTLGVHAVASSLVTIRSTDDLISLHQSEFFERDLPFVLGGGSNILFKNDITKPILKMSISGVDIVEIKDREIFIKIGAGEIWHDFVSWAVLHGYGGTENLALIPGTVGAAPIQNIGAYGVELKDIFESLEIFDMQTGSIKTFTEKDCRFGYRDSIFKHELKGKIIVTSVTLRLRRKDHQINDSYTSLRNYLIEKNIKNPTISDIYHAVVSIRKSKLPDPASLGNAGSFFKNPIVEKSVFERMKNEFQEVPHFVVDKNSVKIPAGWLIEKAGWKGRRVGNVGTYENQALVIVNHGNATGDEIFRHAKSIQNSVKEIFGINLMPEVNVVE